MSDELITPGDIVIKTHNDKDKSQYIYLGLVQPGEQSPLVDEMMKIMNLDDVGYFATYPIVPQVIIADNIVYTMVSVTTWSLSVFKKAIPATTHNPISTSDPALNPTCNTCSRFIAGIDNIKACGINLTYDECDSKYRVSL